MGKAADEQAIARPHSSTVIRRVYVLALLAWLSYVVVYPPWIGRIYPHSQGVYGSWNGAVFKLDRDRAPLWSPPSAYCGRVRWPWQSVSQDSHIELRLIPLVFKSGLGAVVLGVFLRLMHLIVAPHHADRLVCMAWSLSLTLTIALMCFVILGVFVGGHAWTDAVALSAALLGVLGGVVYGAISCLSPPFRSPATTTTGENHTTTLTEKVPGPSSPTQPRQIGNALLAFIAGLLVAVGITIVASRIAASFRGPIGFFSEFATAEYAKPQGVINLTTGLGIAVTGWIGGVLLLYRRAWRGFAIGLPVGTTFLGILFALQYAAVLLSLLVALIIGGTFGAAIGRGHLLFMLLCAGIGVAIGLWAIHVFPPDVIWIWVPMLMGSAWGTVIGRRRLIWMLLFAAIGGAIGLVTGDVLAGVTGEGLRMAVMNTARDMGFPFVFPILILLGSLPGAFLAAVTWIVQRMLDGRGGLRSPLPVRSASPGNVRRRSAMSLAPLFSTKQERAKWREMRQRPMLGDDEFYERFYAGTGIAKEIPIRLRRIYATQLAMQWVWPADKATEFDSELDVAELLAEVEEEFAVDVSDEEALKLDESFDSIVRLVASKLGSVRRES